MRPCYNAPMMRGSDIYELRLFDQPLLRFSFGEDEPAVLHEWDRSAANLMPAGLTLTSEGLWRWLSTRAIPQNRRFASELCRSLGLSTNDRSGILTISKALSLNDSYWIVPENSKETFAECNLFENEFSSVLAAVAYTGVVSNQHGLTPATPELTTNGNLRKAWRIERNGARRLYKGNSNEHKEFGEARAEFLASQIAEAMGLNAVHYGLTSWDEQAARLIGKRQIGELEKLANFEFANCEEHPFPEQFLRDLSKHIRHRAETLASFAPASREKPLARAGISDIGSGTGMAKQAETDNNQNRGERCPSA